MSKIFKKVQVWIALGLPEERKKILLFKVIPERGQGWHPVTGSVEGRESLLSAAKRETAEETGLRVNLKKCKWYDLNYSFEFEGRWGKCAENGFGLWICQSNALLKKEEYPTITLDPREHLLVPLAAFWGL